MLFVHGFGTEAAVNWHPQLPAARRRFRVIAPDLPGFGTSERPVEVCSVGFQVACLRDLLDHLGVERVRLVGHSMGGWIGLAFAASYPRRVERLVLIDAAGLRFEPDPALERVFLPETIEDVRRLIAVNFRRPPPLPRFVLRDVMRMCRREVHTRTAVLRSLVAGADYLDDQLSRVTVPTLVVWGRADSVTPLALGERLAAGIPGAELVIFEDCAHSPNIERPRRFNALLMEFLTGHRDAVLSRSTRLAANG